MMGAAFLVLGVGAAVTGWLLLRRFDTPTSSVTVLQDGKEVKPLPGPIVAPSLLGVAAGYALLLLGLSGAVVGGAILYLR